MTEYTIRVKMPNNMITEVKIQALSYGQASAQAQAYGQVLGCIDQQPLNRVQW
jgi:hypothetical protein